MDFVTVEIAKKLKEKGFKEKCFAYYDPKGCDLYTIQTPFRGVDFEDCMYSYNSLRKECLFVECIDAPTISQALKWLREEKNISVQPLSTRGNRWESQIAFTDENDKKLVEKFLDRSFWAGSRSKTYEEAALAGIQYVIDNLI